jgi:predicted secreted protein
MKVAYQERNLVTWPLRLVFGAFMLALIAALPARAGDAAYLEILGFSADGGIFAFEQYGVQDGSGFPYAERFYIDVDADSWLPGTPIRVRIDDETATVEQAREQARSQGQSIISDEELAAHRGDTAGMSPVTEYSADPHRMAVNPRPVFPPVDDPLEFRIEEVPVMMPERCEMLDETIRGFRLP